jgi:hypothetical protein
MIVSLAGVANASGSATVRRTPLAVLAAVAG